MANFAFNAFKTCLLGSGTRIDLDADTVNAIFFDQGTEVPAVGDDFMDDVTGGRNPAEASAPALGSKTVTLSTNTAVFDAADTVFTALGGGPTTYESLVLYKDTGSEATSPLICHWDSATGLPLTPNGADVTVVWNASGIITIA